MPNWSNRKVVVSDAAAQRLHQTLKFANDKELNAGFTAGVEWAETKATVPELIRLAQAYRGRTDDDLDQEFSMAPVSWAIRPDNRSWDEIKEFWGEVLGDGPGSLSVIGSDLWVRGFVEGAKTFWEAAKPRVEAVKTSPAPADGEAGLARAETVSDPRR